MKTQALILFIGLAAASFAQASSTVCASERLYSSDIRGDFGTQPPPGMKIGSTVIVFNGEVLLNETHRAGEGVYKQAEYRVDLEGEAKTLASEGDPVSGATVFKQLAVLIKVDTINPKNEEELAREEVICRRTWAMVP